MCHTERALCYGVLQCPLQLLPVSWSSAQVHTLVSPLHVLCRACCCLPQAATTAADTEPLRSAEAPGPGSKQRHTAASFKAAWLESSERPQEVSTILILSCNLHTHARHTVGASKHCISAYAYVLMSPEICFCIRRIVSLFPLTAWPFKYCCTTASLGMMLLCCSTVDAFDSFA